MFFVICSVLQMTSSVHGMAAPSPPSSRGCATSGAGRGLLWKHFIHEDTGSNLPNRPRYLRHEEAMLREHRPLL